MEATFDTHSSIHPDQFARPRFLYARARPYPIDAAHTNATNRGPKKEMVTFANWMEEKSHFVEGKRKLDATLKPRLWSGQRTTPAIHVYIST